MELEKDEFVFNESLIKNTTDFLNYLLPEINTVNESEDTQNHKILFMTALAALGFIRSEAGIFVTDITCFEPYHARKALIELRKNDIIGEATGDYQTLFKRAKKRLGWE